MNEVVLVEVGETCMQRLEGMAWNSKRVHSVAPLPQCNPPSPPLPPTIPNIIIVIIIIISSSSSRSSIAYPPAAF